MEKYKADMDTLNGERCVSLYILETFTALYAFYIF